MSQGGSVRSNTFHEKIKNSHCQARQGAVCRELTGRDVLKDQNTTYNLTARVRFGHPPSEFNTINSYEILASAGSVGFDQFALLG